MIKATVIERPGWRLPRDRRHPVFNHQVRALRRVHTCGIVSYCRHEWTAHTTWYLDLPSRCSDRTGSTGPATVRRVPLEPARPDPIRFTQRIRVTFQALGCRSSDTRTVRRCTRYLIARARTDRPSTRASRRIAANSSTFDPNPAPSPDR
jgi:hypothetical protein